MRSPADHRLAQRLRSAAPWAVAESLFTALATVASTVIVARLLAPADFGLAAIVLSVTALLHAFLVNSLLQSVVRMPSVDGPAQDCAFTLIVGVSLACAAACWPLGWLLARLYDEPRLLALVGVGGLDVLVLGLEALPSAMLTRKMRTRSFAIRTFGYRLMTIGLTLGFALAGCGAWAIVLGILGGDIVGAALLWRSQLRRPRVGFDPRVARELVGVAWWISLEQGLATLTVRGFVLVFGKLHGLYWLGMLNFTVRLIDELANLLIMSINRVAMASFGAIKRAGGNLGQAFASGTHRIVLVGAPVMLGFAAVAPDVVPLVSGTHWLPAVPAVQFLAAANCLRLSRVLAPVALRIVGMQTWGTINGLAALIATALVLWLTRDAAPVLAILAYAVRILVTLPLGLTHLARRASISLRQQLEPALWPLFGAGTMAVIVFLATPYLGAMSWLRLAAEIGLGIVVYGLFVALFDRETARMFINRDWKTA